MRLPTVWIFDLGSPIYEWFTSQPQWWQSCARLADGLPLGARILDLGCGPGNSSLAIARARPDVRVVGLDLAPRMLTRARRRLAQARLHGRVALLLASALEIPLAAASTDAVVGHSFLYLVPRRAEVLCEALRVLRPGGTVAFMEPNAAPARLGAVLAQGHDVRFLVSVALWRPFSALHGRFTPRTLAETLCAAGLEDVTVEPELGGLGIVGRGRKPAAG
jgi:ubiquinone/menaquinone biosynthesis C-methylase UbiE